MNGYILDAVAFLLCLAALFAYFNHYILKLPRNIGLLVVAAAASLLRTLIDRLDPSLGARTVLRGIVEQFDLPALFLEILGWTLGPLQPLEQGRDHLSFLGDHRLPGGSSTPPICGTDPAILFWLPSG
jgi:hypothetical protein